MRARAACSFTRRFNTVTSRTHALNLRPKTPRRKRAIVAQVKREVTSQPNEIWALDFMHERPADGSKSRVLTTVDLYSHEYVSIRVSPIVYIP